MVLFNKFNEKYSNKPGLFATHVVEYFHQTDFGPTKIEKLRYHTV